MATSTTMKRNYVTEMLLEGGGGGGSGGGGRGGGGGGGGGGGSNGGRNSWIGDIRTTPAQERMERKGREAGMSGPEARASAKARADDFAATQRAKDVAKDEADYAANKAAGKIKSSFNRDNYAKGGMVRRGYGKARGA